jgi:hypothetical protein
MYKTNDDGSPWSPFPKKPVREKLRRILNSLSPLGYPEALYDDELTNHLAARHKLIGLETPLRQALQTAGFHYLLGGPYDHAVMQDADAERDYLNSLISRAHSLSTELWGIPESHWHGAMQEMEKQGIEMGRVRALGGEWHTPNRDRDLKFALARLLNTFGQTLTRHRDELNVQPKSPDRGRPKIHTYGLECFCATMGEFWTRTAKRKFTASYSGPNVKSPVIAFIVDALEPLDDVPRPAIVTAVRVVRSEVNSDIKESEAADILSTKTLDE